MLQKRSFLVGSVLAGVEEEVEVEVSTSICKVWGGGGVSKRSVACDHCEGTLARE